MTSNGLDAKAALQQAEANAVANLQTAAERKTTTTVLVATPVPAVVLGAGEIALNFGIQSFIQPMPNLKEWQQVISDFVAADPQVGEINLDTPGGFGGRTQFVGNQLIHPIPEPLIKTGSPPAESAQGCL